MRVFAMKRFCPFSHKQNYVNGKLNNLEIKH